jgi:hypothetical protein
VWLRWIITDLQRRATETAVSLAGNKQLLYSDIILYLGLRQLS